MTFLARSPVGIVASLAVALAACEQSTIIEGSISVAPALAPATSAPLLVIVDGSATPDTAWSPVGKSGEDADQPFAPSASGYHYRWEQFGQPPRALYVAAFVDVNANGVLDLGEPYGSWASNPLVDAKWGSTAPANYIDLVIDTR